MGKGTTPARYFENPRTEMLARVPADSRRILEVGCGAGAFAALLKQQDSSRFIVGVEPEAGILNQAAGSVDVPLAGLLGDVDLGPVPFDLVIMNDVLEHMVDPWAALATAHASLKPGGSLLISVPTVRSLAVLRPLVVSGSFAYQDQGMMDRTHLRWFTRRSIEAAVQAAGFVAIESAPVSRVKGRAAKALSLFCDELGVRQYGVNAKKA